MTPRRHVMDRCNLTILLDPSQDGLAEFLAEHRVEIVASMPCYSSRNVDEQRSNGVFDASIEALQMLNRLGYGRDSALPLNLVYNSVGAFLPGPQGKLKEDYKRELLAHFGIGRDTLNMGWTGEVFDCDFNQMLKMQWRDGEGRGLFLWDIDPAQVENREILTADLPAARPANGWLKNADRSSTARAPRFVPSFQACSRERC